MWNEASRRRFIKASLVGAGGLIVGGEPLLSLSVADLVAQPVSLPVGSAPQPVALPHFPDRLFAFVWRNWQLVPIDRLAKVVDARPAEILRLGRTMGLSNPPHITVDQQRRSYITVIRRNWHLLPYEQLLKLLGWSAEQLAFALREDDFLFVKLGSLKPRCEPLTYEAPSETTLQRARAITRLVRGDFPNGVGEMREPLFSFVSDLSHAPPASRFTHHRSRSVFSPRFCYSYFALYGDPLLDPQVDPYPDGYLARMAATGVDGVWLQAVLHKLAPFPWDASLSARWKERLANLQALAARARKRGIGVYLYLNEPRAMPLAFFGSRPEMKGVVEGDHAALCTSNPEVQEYLVGAVATISRAVPNLAGFFTITGSENLTNCWSHGGGANCPRCGKRAPADVIAELNTLFHEGIRQSGGSACLIVGDWGWADDWCAAIIDKLPPDAALMSVSEWSVPILRGGVASVVSEYSVSAIGPGRRATQHWDLARQRGLKTIAKIQAGNTWELSAVPYIPVVANVAQHAANLRQAKVDGLMLGWTLGGYPSPNLEVVAEVGRVEAPPTPEQGMETVARRRFGDTLAPLVVRAWRDFSAALSEFPFHARLLYTAPMQYGPANLLWSEPTGYKATMVGFPYDDLEAWRQVYPPEVFIAQFTKIADGFEDAITTLRAAAKKVKATRPQEEALVGELRVAEAAAIHFRTTANQARFIQALRALVPAKTAEAARPLFTEIERILTGEIALARRLYAIQTRDSRIGFEASNQYYYVPLDLVEKVVNCRDLLTRWLPQQRRARSL